MPALNHDLIALSLADEIAAHRPRWPAALLPPAGIEAALAAASGLPPIFHWLILEGRLTGDPRVDLMACVIDGPGVRGAVADALADPAPALAGAGRLLGAWSRPADHPRRRCLEDTPVVWLEWDAPFTRPPLELPFIDRRFWGPRGPAPTVDELVEMIEGHHEATFADALPRPRLASFRRTIAALPRGARALAAASLGPRGIDRERLFASVPQARVLPWLDAIGWPGDRQALRAWLPRIVAPWEEAFLQIELDERRDGPTAYLGIEPRQGELGGVEGRERGRFLRLLARDGLADPARVAATWAWVAGGGARPAGPPVVRSVHLKCVLTPGAPIEVKAYLGLHRRRPRPRRRAAARIDAAALGSA